MLVASRILFGPEIPEISVLLQLSVIKATIRKLDLEDS